MMLADSAQAVGGKLYVLGGGWDVTTGATPHAVVLLLSVPWAQTNKKHKMRLSLVTGDGQPFVLPTPKGPQQLFFDTEFEVGRPPGMSAGTSQNIPLTVTIGPLPYEPGRYEWRLSINDAGRDDWTLPFECRQAPAQTQM